MNSHLLMTEASNIDWNEKRVIDNNKLDKAIIPWEDDIEVTHGLDGKKETIKMKNVSLFDHILLKDGKKYKILHMLSK